MREERLRNAANDVGFRVTDEKGASWFKSMPNSATTQTKACIQRTSGGGGLLNQRAAVEQDIVHID